jgi:predicted permease
VNWRLAARSIGTNPLLLAGVLGLIVSLLHLTLPSFLQKTMELLSAAAVPIALLCIGGSLVTIPLHGKHAGIIVAALMKTALLPLIVFGLGRLAGFDVAEQRIALVLSSCPTAAAAFVMARQMGGDEALASASIALSTILSAFSLAVALWVGS